MLLDNDELMLLKCKTKKSYIYIDSTILHLRIRYDDCVESIQASGYTIPDVDPNLTSSFQDQFVSRKPDLFVVSETTVKGFI